MDGTTDSSVYIVTFNCGRSLIDVGAFADELFNGLSLPAALPDILVLCLQEIAPVAHSFIGGSFLDPYYLRFMEAVQRAALAQQDCPIDTDEPYKVACIRNVGMISIMIFAKQSIYNGIEDIETGGVGLGHANMGNKAAVGVRFKLRFEDRGTDLTFISAHLAPHEFALQRRNEDWKNIVRRLVFSSSATGTQVISSTAGEERPLLSLDPHDSTIYKSSSHLFVAGDLNYRTSLISPSPTDHIDSFPQPNHDRSSPRSFTKFFTNDQLSQEREAGRTCHDLIEPDVTFPPTYKYDTNAAPTHADDETLPWAKHRWPSWCDRILFREMPASKGKLEALKYVSLGMLRTSDHRPVALHLRVRLSDMAASTDYEGEIAAPPFGIDVDWRVKRQRGRILELFNGYILYCTTTTDGAMASIGVLAGIAALYFGLKALL